MRLAVDDEQFDLRLAYRHGEPVRVSVGDARFDIEVQHDDGHEVQLIVDGAHESGLCWMQGDEGWLDAGGACAAFVDRSQAPPEVDDAEGHGLIVSRMHGQLAKLAVALGQRVRKGEFVLAIEAMKMEHRIEAPLDGTVVEVGAAAGTQVAPGKLLIRIEADAA